MCACASVCKHICVCSRARSHTHFPRLFSVEISSMGQEPRRARGLPWPEPRVYLELGTISRVPRGPCGKEAGRRMQSGGGELVAGSPTLLQYFEICKDFSRQTFSRDACKTSQNTKSYPVYINFTQQGEITEKGSAFLLTNVFSYIAKIRNNFGSIFTLTSTTFRTVLPSLLHWNSVLVALLVAWDPLWQPMAFS